MVASHDLGHPGPDGFDYARCLVAEDHREGPRARPVDHRLVRVAQPRGGDPDEHLARTGQGKVYGFHGQRFRSSEGSRGPGVAQDCGTNLHRHILAGRRHP